MNRSFSLSKLSAAIGAVALLGASSMASAAVVNGSDFTNGQSTQTLGGFDWAISPSNLKFQKKTLGGYTGVGINGTPTTDEIDIGEFLTGTSVNGLFGVFSLRLGVLFDGPEFNDVNEIAQVTATLQNNTTIVRTLTATGTTTALWSDPSGSVTMLSPANSTGGGAVWEIANPFGMINNFTKISFTALTGICGSTGGTCRNQSDFTLVQLETSPGGSITGNPVPEPASLALVGLGLLGMAVARRRRA